MAQRPKPAPHIFRWVLVTSSIGTYLFGMGAGLLLYPVLPYPALIGFAVFGLGLLVFAVSVAVRQANQ